jgi:hypothetical protein
MAAIVTDRFRQYDADRLIAQLNAGSPTLLYLFIGQTASWADDNNPPTPTYNVQDEYTIYDSIVAMKKVVVSSISKVITRYDWVNGTTYAVYNSANANLLSSNFYVFTTDFNVYKCIWNNNAAPSTVMPTGTGTTNITTADGYIWKYMYTVSPSDSLKYVTSAWIPVATNGTVSAAAIAGTVEFIKVTNGGAGYTGTPVVTITGDGTGATATPVVVAGVITSITVTSKGSGYTRITVAITGGNGSGATATASIAPPGGHGSNAPWELGGFNVMLDVTLNGSESGTFPTNISYRQIGILRDPILSSDGVSAATAAAYAAASIQRATGEIMYVENRRPVTRASNQNEDIKIILTF